MFNFFRRQEDNVRISSAAASEDLRGRPPLVRAMEALIMNAYDVTFKRMSVRQPACFSSAPTSRKPLSLLVSSTTGCLIMTCSKSSLNQLQNCYKSPRNRGFSCSMIRQPFPTRQNTMQEFRPQAPSAETVFYRTYSRRKQDGTRENFQEAMTRTVEDIGSYRQVHRRRAALVKEQALAQHSFPSGRAFWVAGTEWGQKQENFSGYYNCTSTHMGDLNAFGLMVDLAMQGSGTGAVLEQDVIDQLPAVENTIQRWSRCTEIGAKLPEYRQERPALTPCCLLAWCRFGSATVARVGGGLPASRQPGLQRSATVTRATSGSSWTCPASALLVSASRDSVAPPTRSSWK